MEKMLLMWMIMMKMIDIVIYLMTKWSNYLVYYKCIINTINTLTVPLGLVLDNYAMTD